MAKPSISVDLQIASDAADLPSSGDITDWLSLAVAEANVDCGACEVTVRVVGEDEIRIVLKDFEI